MGAALAFVAALQHLSGTQRAILLLRDGHEYSAADAADMLDTAVASVNSAQQRAQKTVKDKMPAVSQAAASQSLGEENLCKLLGSLVTAWENRNIEAGAPLHRRRPIRDTAAAGTVRRPGVGR